MATGTITDKINNVVALLIDQCNCPISIPLSCRSKRRCGAGKGEHLVIGNGAETDVNAGLVELIKEAFAIRNQFLSGSHDSIEALSGRLGRALTR
jgi:hypothetical protein